MVEIITEKAYAVMIDSQAPIHFGGKQSTRLAISIREYQVQP
jgi:hypothetical protein